MRSPERTRCKGRTTSWVDIPRLKLCGRGADISIPVRLTALDSPKLMPLDTRTLNGESISPQGAAVSTGREGRASGAAHRIVQSHAFDAFFHRALTETGTVDGRSILAGVAQRLAFEDAQHLIGRREDGLAEMLFATGLGLLEGTSLGSEGGEVVLKESPFARTRHSLLGEAATPVCDVTRGVIAGTLRSQRGRAFQVEEVACVATGAPGCRFRISAAETALEGGEDGLHLEPELRGPAAEAIPPGTTPAGVMAALRVLFAADGETLLPPPGGSYGRLWGLLYAESAARFECQIPVRMGQKFATLAPIVLTEVGHLASFHSFGALLRSPEWRERIAPELGDREAAVHALVALLNAFGWGAWRVHVLAPYERFTVRVYDGFEAAGRLDSLEPAGPSCYFGRGVAAGIMNLIYVADPGSPEPLSTSLYNRLFRSPLSFRTTETRCVAAGDPYCEFVANPLSPGLRPNPFMR
jgi:predicted hydrocarbon binding protein